MLPGCEYEPNTLLTYESFYHGMMNFPARHPAVNDMEQDMSDCPDGPDCSLRGHTRSGYTFTIAYYPEDENITECVSMGIVLMKSNCDTDPEALDHMTAKMHHDIPGTDALQLYSIQMEKGFALSLGGEFVLTKKHTLGEVDTLFDALCHSAPKAYGEFCVPLISGVMIPVHAKRR